MASSQDGLSWVKHNSDLIEDLLNENEAQASPDVIKLDMLILLT